MILIKRRAVLLGIPGALGSLPPGAFAQPQQSISAEPWTTPPVSGPGVVYKTLESASAGAAVSLHVYLPPHYEAEPARRFPVVVWLHGSGGGAAGVPVLAALFDRAIRTHAVPPMIVVFPNGRGVSMWCDARDGSSPVETVALNDVIPFVDRTFRTIAVPQARAVEGFSMGGYGAARWGFAHRNIFSAVSMLGAGPLDPDFTPVPANAALRERVLETVYGGDVVYFRALSPWSIAEQEAGALSGTPIRIAIGARDRTALANRAFHRHLTRLNILHDYEELPHIGHDPVALITALGDRMWAFHRRAFGQL